MDKNGFRNFLQERKVPEHKIEPFISIAEKFEGWLGASGKKSPIKDDVLAFSAVLIGEGLNTFDNYLALARYGQFLKDNALSSAVIELLDGAEVMDNLYERLGKVVGEQKRDEVFQGIVLPPLGAPNVQRPLVTQVVMERLENLVAPDVYRAMLADCLRTLGDGDPEERKKFLTCKSLDEFLHRKGDEYIAFLERLKTEKRLYFTQEITDQVIAYVQSHPEIRQGVRQGNILYEVKIPHMTQEYLAETDERMKRYYYCHCPWIKESLRTGNVRVSPTFCLCSAGFHKKYWEGVFGQPLKAEIVESVLKGDPWCKIAIHLPEGYEEGMRA